MSEILLPPCVYCSESPESSGGGSGVIRFGRYLRRDDGKTVQRYRCKNCGGSFSEASLQYCFRQKKRHLNGIIFMMLSSTNSQRRAAINLRINRKTVVRKFLFMGHHAKNYISLLNNYHAPVEHMQFDDLETSVHSKFKPVSVTLAVEHPTRRILNFKVASMPAKGTLTHIALKKYGPRQDDRRLKRRSLFEELQPFLTADAKISSDMNRAYPPDVKEFFPSCHHFTTRGRRGCVTGQGELKRGGFDPLFSLNHTCAMLRANINRLLRRTWCTTKIIERLELHIAIYALYHNLVLLKKTS